MTHVPKGSFHGCWQALTLALPLALFYYDDYYYYYYYYYFIPIAAGRSAWRQVPGSALHRCFKSTRTTWASPATNSCKLATYSTCQENGAKLQARSSCGRNPTGTHALGV